MTRDAIMTCMLPTTLPVLMLPKATILGLLAMAMPSTLPANNSPSSPTLPPSSVPANKTIDTMRTGLSAAKTI
ncbi:hypothetical protein AAF712_015585, partial [Marasmius tenuissimus]